MTDINLEDNKSVVVHFRVTWEENQRIIEMAKDSKTKSEFIRHRVLGTTEEE